MNSAIPVELSFRSSSAKRRTLKQGTGIRGAGLILVTVGALMAGGCSRDSAATESSSTSTTAPTTTTTVATSTSSTAMVSTTAENQPTTTTLAVPLADTVVVTVEDSVWRVEPADVVVGPPGGIRILVVNDTDEAQEIIFVSLFGGSPDDLPVVDGLVDVSRCNQIFGDEDEENPSPATFGCFGSTGEAHPIDVFQLRAGETLPLDDGVPAGVHLIIDNRDGGYGSGRYASFEVLDIEEQ